MAYTPKVIGNSELSAETLTAIGTDIGVGVTVVQDNIETLHAYGDVVLSETSMTNAFLKALVNKIVKTRFVDTAYKSRLAVTFKGVLEIGDGVEEIFVAPANPDAEITDYDHPDSPYEADLPDVKAEWHVTNAKMRYSTRVTELELRKAFTNFGAMDGLVQRIVDSLFNGYEWDSQLLTKYKLAQLILARIAASKVVTVPSPVTSDGTAFLAGAREYAELFKWMRSEYNDAGVPTKTKEGNEYIIMPAGIESHVDVKDLAAAFNLSYADFIGRRLPVDAFTFTAAEKARIMKIGKLNSWTFTQEQETALAGVIGVLCDIDILQFYDTYEPKLYTLENGSTAENIFWLHCAKVCGVSPFANAVVFVAGADEPEELDVQPGT